MIGNKAKRTILGGIAASIAIVLSLAGCGGAQTASSGTAAGKGGSSTVPDLSNVIDAVKEDSDLNGLLPENIKAKGSITIGSGFHSVPDHFYSADGKTQIGDEVDLAKAIGNRLGVKVEHEDMAFDALIAGLKANRVDIIFADMSDTAERQKQIDFVDYLNSGLVFTVRKGNPANIHGEDDICGKKVALVTGSSQVKYAEEKSKECEANGNKPIDLVYTDNLDDNETQLASGRIDFMINDLGTASYLAKTFKNGNAFEVVDMPVIDAGPLGIGVAKDDTQLRDAIQKALQSLIDDGTYSKIIDGWGLSKAAVKQATVNSGK